MLTKANEELQKCDLEQLFSVCVPVSVAGSSQGGGNTQMSYCVEHLQIPALIIEATYHGSRDGRLFGKWEYMQYGRALAVALARVALGE